MPEPTEVKTKTRGHGRTPRGLEALQKQKAAGPLADASKEFGSRFGRLFPASAERPADDDLQELAAAMVADPDPPKDGFDSEESGIPALYTYFGQFIDHDITFDPEPNFSKIKDVTAVVDFRTPAFDLDNVYGRGPDDQPYMYDSHQQGGHTETRFLLGEPLTGGSPLGDAARDLPRNTQGRALIGDPRNDENSIVSQLQGLFHRAHNRLVHEQSLSFEDAQRCLRDHYQYLVVNDFLPKIVNGQVLDGLKAGGRYSEEKLSLFASFSSSFFLPVEFSVACYRLGHSMVRPGYRLNDRVLEAIFPFDMRDKRIHYSEGLTGFRRMVSDWAIDWGRFIDIDVREYGPNPDTKDKDLSDQQRKALLKRLQFAYKIDTSLVDPLGSLPPSVAIKPASLALRNLERGRQYSLPTGQEVAHAVGLTPLLDKDILIGKADGSKRHAISKIANGAFDGKCPLWTYILAEATVNPLPVPIPVTHGPTPVATPQLGPVGGGVVAQTFLKMLFADSKSFLSENPTWAPSHVKTLAEFVKFAVGEPGLTMTPRP